METVAKWEAPPENDARILGMPNIPKPLHGKNCQPRTIVGKTNWDKMRRRCYFNAKYKCEICGYESTKPADIHAHEVFSIDYESGESKFERLICLCKKCHLSGIHSGRALTMYKHGNPLYDKKHLLDGVEHTFQQVAKWNNEHDEKIKMFNVIHSYRKEPELKEDIDKLIEKYNIEFYRPPRADKAAKWGDWKMIYNGREYKTPYKDEAEWEETMAKLNKEQKRFEMIERMSGGVFDDIDKLIKELGEED